MIRSPTLCASSPPEPEQSEVTVKGMKQEDTQGFNIANAVYRQSLRDPARLAIAFEGLEISYGELADRARRIAATLVQSPGWGAGEDFLPRVGILASRSIDACTGLLGTSWAGGTYIPIGLKSPEDRLITILDQCQLSALICDAQGAKLLTERVLALCPPLVLMPEPRRHLPAGSSPEIDIQDLHDLPALADATPPAHIKSTDLAYIIFTSGTTGTPKGVMISAGAVHHYIEVVTEILGLHASDRALEVCELSFDFSVLDMFATWQVGASLHVLPANRVMNAVKFARECRLTVWNSVPSLVGMLNQIKALKPGVLPDLRLTVFGGEPLPANTVEAWQQAAPNSVVQNLYGPTEVTVSCLSQPVTTPLLVTPKRNVIAIGSPFPGIEAAILTADHQFAPTDEPGELALSGAQLAEGYLNAKELTEARFPIIGGKRWYLTGDLAFCDTSGAFHHLGRIDNQVKVLGNRVELEEIDTHLRELSQTELVATVAWPLIDGSARGLIAFIAGSPMETSLILTGLKRQLPAYSVPSRIVHIEQMPLNHNGKVDRGALVRTLECDGH
ncbi:MAG: amino acid adenylation domain-containing protein [Proteobacteria bacterium]|nr:amino acid adenylation domain-containing protein [Pseudomonadota bacterium]